jgi:hypothetical protein
MINEIFNGDSASEIRAKLNEMITIINYYSSSQFVGSPNPGEGGGGYVPPSSDTIDVWNNGAANPSPMADASSACSAIQVSNFHTVYLQKDPANMGGTQVPQANDYLYTDSAKTMALSMGYYGYRDTAMMMNKFIYVDMMGRITEISYCA